MFKWQYGRQGSGYRILKLFESALLKCDCYILHYPEGSYINTHVDPAIEGFEHHRINIVFKDCELGGNFYLEDPYDDNRPDYEGWDGFYRFVKFRPDIQPHGVSRVIRGNRWVFSFGWLTPEGY